MLGVAVTSSTDGTRSIAPGHDVSWVFDVTNETTQSGLFDVSATGTAGFDTRVRSAQGVAVTSVQLGGRETTCVVATISVPDTASVGTIDVTSLTATLESSPSVTASDAVVTEVLDGLTITPDNTGTASPNTKIAYRHVITNSWPTTQTITLSETDSSGWPIVLLAADGVTEVTSVTIGPFGGKAEMVAQVSVPAQASPAATDTLSILATEESATATATDTTSVRRVDTYSSSAYTTPTGDFKLGDSVYARAIGLDASSAVCFVWKAPDGAVKRTSPTSTVDASGTASDQYSSETSDAVGAWVVELHGDGPDGPLIEARQFTVDFKGEITSVSASDGRNVEATIAVSSAVANETSREITGSVMSYLVWWDDNNNGAYDEGDTYIDASGTPQPYAAPAATHVTPIPSVLASGTWTEPAPWAISNTLFPNQGTYNVTATWHSPSGAAIDRKTAQFFAVPALGWPPFAVLVGAIGCVIWRQRGLSAAGSNA